MQTVKQLTGKLMIQNILGAGSSFSDNIKLQCSLLLFSVYV